MILERFENVVIQVEPNFLYKCKVHEVLQENLHLSSGEFAQGPYTGLHGSCGVALDTLFFKLAVIN